VPPSIRPTGSGQLRAIVAAARHMAVGGRIINHLVDGIFAPWRSWHRQHASTKAALNAIDRQGAVDLAERGIRVNAILPELIRTRALRQRAVFFGEVVARASSRGVGNAADVAGAALDLASQASA